MDYKQCFSCKKQLPLIDFDVDNRKYQLPSDKGTCKVCKQCEFNKACEELSTIKFNYEIQKFEIITFNTIEEVKQYFNK